MDTASASITNTLKGACAIDLKRVRLIIIMFYSTPNVPLSTADINRCLAKSLDNFTDYIVLVLEPQQGKIVYSSLGLQYITGYSVSERQNKTLESLFLPVAGRSPAMYMKTLLEQANANPHADYKDPGLQRLQVKNRGEGKPLEVQAEIRIKANRDERTLLSYTVTIHPLTNNEINRHLIEGIHNIGDYAIFMISPQGRILSWNNGAEKIKGYSASEMIGQSIEVFYPPEAIPPDRTVTQHVQWILSEAFKNKRYTELGWRKRQKQNAQGQKIGEELFWASIVLTPIIDTDNTFHGYIKIVRDLTEQKNADLRLETKNKQLKKMLEVGEIGLSEFSLTEKRIRWHPEMFHIYGLPVSSDSTPDVELVKSRVYPDDQARIYACYQEIIEGKRKEFNEEYRISRADDGSIRILWAHYMLHPESKTLFGLTWDVTDRKLREEKLNFILTTHKIGTWQWTIISDPDPEKQKIIWDKGSFALYGQDPNTFIPSYASMKNIIKDSAAADAITQAALTRQISKSEIEEPYEIEYTVTWPVGYRPDIPVRDRTIVSRGQVFRDANGNPTKLAGISWDGTERKQLDNERVVAAQRLQQQEQQQRQQQSGFISTTCHELRTPLNGIITGGSYMKEPLDTMKKYLAALEESPAKESLTALVAELQEYQTVIADSADHLRMLTTNVLDFASFTYKNELKADLYQLGYVVGRIKGMSLPATKNKGLAFIVTDTYQKDLWLKIDITGVTQIFNNLISNSIKFTPTGSITLEYKVFPEATRLRLVFNIIDTGIGMSKEELGRMFQAYSQANDQTKENYGGTGLGLMISKNLAIRMGGDITVSSIKDLGSTFTVTLYGDAATPAEIEAHQRKDQTALENPPSSPLAVRASVPAASPANFSAALPKQKILVMEDNPTNQLMLGKILKEYYDITEANDGLIGLNLYKANYQVFEAILMDTQMPNMDGLEASRQIRNFEQQTGIRRIPIISMSADADKASVEATEAAGMDSHVAKPFKPKELRDMLSKTILQKYTSAPVSSKSLENLRSRRSSQNLLNLELQQLST